MKDEKTAWQLYIQIMHFVGLFSVLNLTLLFFWEAVRGNMGLSAFLEFFLVLVFLIVLAIFFFIFLLFGPPISEKILKVFTKWIFIIAPAFLILAHQWVLPKDNGGFIMALVESYTEGKSADFDFLQAFPMTLLVSTILTYIINRKFFKITED